jgi:hypothetical protein
MLRCVAEHLHLGTLLYPLLSEARQDSRDVLRQVVLAAVLAYLGRDILDDDYRIIPSQCHRDQAGTSLTLSTDDAGHRG